MGSMSASSNAKASLSAKSRPEEGRVGPFRGGSRRRTESENRMRRADGRSEANDASGSAFAHATVFALEVRIRKAHAEREARRVIRARSARRQAQPESDPRQAERDGREPPHAFFDAAVVRLAAGHVRRPTSSRRCPKLKRNATGRRSPETTFAERASLSGARRSILASRRAFPSAPEQEPSVARIVHVGSRVFEDEEGVSERASLRGRQGRRERSACGAELPSR